jgi:hypothetical protein
MWLHYVVHVRSCTSVVHSLCTYVVVYESTFVPSKVHSVPSKVSDIPSTEVLSYLRRYFVPSVRHNTRPCTYTTTRTCTMFICENTIIRTVQLVLSCWGLATYLRTHINRFFSGCALFRTEVRKYLVWKYLLFRTSVGKYICVHKNKNRIVYSYLRLHVRTCTRTSTVHVYTTLFLSIYFCTLCSSILPEVRTKK